MKSIYPTPEKDCEYYQELKRNGKRRCDKYKDWDILCERCPYGYTEPEYGE